MSPARVAIEHARADVVAERHGPHEARAADPELFADRKRGGHRVAAGMPSTRPRIVCLVGVGQHAVGQRRLNGTTERGVADDGGECVAGVGSGEGDGRPARWQLGARDHRGDGVEDVPLRLLEHLVRQRAVSRLAHVGGEPRRDVADRMTAGRRHPRRGLRLRRSRDARGWPGGRRDHPSRALQHAPPAPSGALPKPRARIPIVA